MQCMLCACIQTIQVRVRAPPTRPTVYEAKRQTGVWRAPTCSCTGMALGMTGNQTGSCISR